MLRMTGSAIAAVSDVPDAGYLRDLADNCCKPVSAGAFTETQPCTGRSAFRREDHEGCVRWYAVHIQQLNHAQEGRYARVTSEGQDNFRSV